MLENELLPRVILVAMQHFRGLVATYAISRETGAGWLLGSRRAMIGRGREGSECDARRR